MLTPEQIEGFRLAAGRLIDPVNTYLLKDIARRIQEAGKLTSTAAYEAWQVEWLGKGRKELERELSQLLGVTRREARKLLRSAARYGYDTTLSRYPGHLVPFDTNQAIQQIVSAAVTLAGDELKNITQTKAILMVDPYGRYQTLPKAYCACTDYAFQQVFTGAADYNIVMSVLPMFTITRWPASTCTTRPRAEEVLYAYCRLDFAAGGTGLHLPALR